MCSPNRYRQSSANSEHQNSVSVAINENRSPNEEDAAESEIETQQISNSIEINENHVHGDETNSSREEDPLCNPEADDPEVEEQVDVLREQSIGDTVYSKRFVLSQLMKLVERQYELDDEFENNLSLLWDMTQERDVALFMAENNALEVFREVIELAENLRLIEIAVGIVGNMCVEKKILNDYRKEFPVYLHMFSCTDAPTLIQLMRLFKTIFSVDDLTHSWLEIISHVPNFFENFTSILNNSTNKVLLANGLSTVNCMLQRLSTLEWKKISDNGLTVADIFVKSEFVQSIFVAYDFLDAQYNLPDDFDEHVNTEYDEYDVINCFFAIHCTLMQFREVSREVYKKVMPSLVCNINAQLKEFQNTLTIITLPINFVEDILLSACEIHIYNMNFGYNCNIEGFKYILKIWISINFSLLEEEEEENANTPTFIDLRDSLVKCMATMIDKCEEDELIELFLEQDDSSLLKLSSLYKDGDESDRTRAQNIIVILDKQKNNEENNETPNEQLAI